MARKDCWSIEDCWIGAIRRRKVGKILTYAEPGFAIQNLALVSFPLCMENSTTDSFHFPVLILSRRALLSYQHFRLFCRPGRFANS